VKLPLQYILKQLFLRRSVWCIHRRMIRVSLGPEFYIFNNCSSGYTDISMMYCSEQTEMYTLHLWGILYAPEYGHQLRVEFNRILWFGIGDRSTGSRSAGKINFYCRCVQQSCLTVQYRKLGLHSAWIHRCYKPLLYFMFTQMHLTVVLK
jgi:hypothetical protein